LEHSNYQIFKQLHYKKEAFLLPNVWDVKSAITLQESGFKAIDTSSAAVAKTLGDGDGEECLLMNCCL